MSPRISYDELAKQNVAKLLKYATERLFLDEADYFYAQNQLLDALKIQEPGQYSDIQVGDIYDVVENLSAYAARKKLIDENERRNFETKLIGYCMPTPSKVIETFDDIASFEGVDKACDYLHRLGIDSLYLRQKDFDKNIIGSTNRRAETSRSQSTFQNPKKRPNKCALQKRQRPVIQNAPFAPKTSALQATWLWRQDKQSAQSRLNLTAKIGLCSFHRTATSSNTQ